MKRSVLLIAALVVIVSMSVYAQDPDDPGSPDSLIFGNIDVDFAPGQDIYVDVPVYFVTDDSIASVMIPVEFTTTDGRVSLVSATWNGVFQQWEDTYNSDDYSWYVGFHDLGGEEGEPVLNTGGTRFEGITLEFRIEADAEEQLVRINLGEGPHDLPVNFGLMTADSDEDITPRVANGFIRYGAVGIDDDNDGLPAEYALKQNYPNPFNPETNIEYQLPQAGLVTIEIFNILGQNVRTLLSENRDAGVHTAHWNGVNNDGQMVPSGIYFYRITSGNYSETKKMVMIK
jgi:hypothetical protein